MIDADAVSIFDEPELARGGREPGEVVGFSAAFPDGFAYCAWGKGILIDAVEDDGFAKIAADE